MIERAPAIYKEQYISDLQAYGLSQVDFLGWRYNSANFNPRIFNAANEAAFKGTGYISSVYYDLLTRRQAFATVSDAYFEDTIWDYDDYQNHGSPVQRLSLIHI